MKKGLCLGLCCPLPWTLLLHSLPSPDVSLSFQRPGFWDPPPLLKSQVQTSIPYYVSELSAVPNQRQPDLLLLLLIDLIFSYQRAGRDWGGRSQHISDVGSLMTGNLGHGLALISPSQSFGSLKGHFQLLLSPQTPVLDGEKVEGLIRPVYLSNLPKPRALDRNSQHPYLSTGHS